MYFFERNESFIDTNLLESTYSTYIYPNCKKGGDLVGPGMSEGFSVNTGLRQGSAVSPLMFIIVMELISRKVNRRGSIGRILYADDLAIMESGQEMEEVLGEGKEVFEKHGLKMSMEKTEVMWAGQQRKN